jgi:4-aminobutyrate aminotransferase-like enzyme
MDQGVIVLLAGSNVIRLLPPLVITREEIDVVLDAMQKTLK